MSLQNDANSTRLSLAIADIPLTPLGMKSSKPVPSSFNKENAIIVSKLSRRHHHMKTPKPHRNLEKIDNQNERPAEDDVLSHFSCFVNKRRGKKLPLQITNISNIPEVNATRDDTELFNSDRDLSIVDIRPTLPLPKYFLSPRNIRRDSFYTDIDDGSFVEFIDNKVIEKSYIPRHFYTCSGSSENETQFSTSSKIPVAEVGFRKFVDAIQKQRNCIMEEEEIIESSENQPNISSQIFSSRPSNESILNGLSKNHYAMNSTLMNTGINASRPNLEISSLNMIDRTSQNIKYSHIECITLTSDESDSDSKIESPHSSKHLGLVRSSLISKNIVVQNTGTGTPVPVSVNPPTVHQKAISNSPLALEIDRVSNWVLTSPFKSIVSEVEISEDEDNAFDLAANILMPSQKLDLHLSLSDSNSPSIDGPLNNSGGTIFTIERIESPNADKSKNVFEKTEQILHEVQSSNGSILYSSDESSGSTLRSARKLQKRQSISTPFLILSRKSNLQKTIVIDSDCNESYSSVSPQSSSSTSGEQKLARNVPCFKYLAKVPIDQRKLSFQESMRRLMLSDDSHDDNDKNAFRQICSTDNYLSKDTSRPTDTSEKESNKSNSVIDNSFKTVCTKLVFNDSNSPLNDLNDSDMRKDPNHLLSTKKSPQQVKYTAHTSSENDADFDSYINKWKQNSEETRKNSPLDDKNSSFINDQESSDESNNSFINDKEERKNRDSSFGNDNSANSPAFESLTVKVAVPITTKKYAKPSSRSVFSSSSDEYDIDFTPFRTKKVNKKLQIQKVKNNPSPFVKKSLTFLQSLAAEIPLEKAHNDAIPYLTNFKKQRDSLAIELFNYYNKRVFDDLLPKDTKVTWNVHLRKTAGYCKNRIDRTKKYERSSAIELSVKIIDNPARLRDTLIHEMCHSATWLISGVADGHGQIWKGWATKSMMTFPELPPIRRCHSYIIQYKFVYVCTNKDCGQRIGRHSKSLDLNKKVCGFCRNKFELQVNTNRKKGGRTESVPVTPRRPNPFATFVKENYSSVKKTRANLKHGDVMKALSEAFGKLKTTKDNNYEIQ